MTGVGPVCGPCNSYCLSVLPGSHQHCQQLRAGSSWSCAAHPQLGLCPCDVGLDCCHWSTQDQALHSNSVCGAEDHVCQAEAFSLWSQQCQWHYHWRVWFKCGRFCLAMPKGVESPMAFPGGNPSRVSCDATTSLGSQIRWNHRCES